MTNKNHLLILSVFTGIIFAGACKPGKNADDLKADSIQAKMTEDSIALSKNAGDHAHNSAYKAGTGKINPAKKNGKGTVILETNAEMEKEYNAMKIEVDSMGIYSRTEVRPTYPGGQKALAKFIQDNIVYPEPAIENGVEGDVNVVFAVDENGKVYTPVVKGVPVGYGLDEAATDVVSKMPKWNPGQIKGKNVKSYYTLPIIFRIN